MSDPVFIFNFQSGGKTNKVTYFVENVLPARKIRDTGSISVGYVRTSKYEAHPSSSDRRLNQKTKWRRVRPNTAIKTL